MKKNKALLSIILIIVIMLVAGASIYIASKVGQEQAIAPTAPASEPMACDAQCPATSNSNLLLSCTPSSDGSLQSLCNSKGRTEPCGGETYCCPSVGGAWTTDMTNCKTPTPTKTPAPTPTKTPVWVGSAACTVTGVATTIACVASDVITCAPDCPTECGKIASTISTCTNSCGIATTKACPATAACTEDLEVTKKAYKYVGGTYAYTTEIDTVAKNQTFIYAISIENFGEIDVTNVNITDTLNGEKQDQLAFVDAKSGCTYSASERKVTCNGLTVKAGEENVYAFKVKVANEAVNGDIIKNVAVVNAVGTDISAANELTISTVVGCNHTCTGDSECSTGLVCDTSTNKCRKEACTEEDTCSCPVPRAAAPARPTTIRTPAPTEVVEEVVITDAPLPTERPVAIAEPTVLPEAGILDFPGVAAFGGGLMLAIIGILLAL